MTDMRAEQKAMPDKHRVQLDFSEDAFRALQGLKTRINASTNAEVIRHALGLLKWVVNEAAENKRLLVEGDHEIRELVLPFIISRREAEHAKEMVGQAGGS
jgi:hypothetical protein